jgi:hypothetical protein
MLPDFLILPGQDSHLQAFTGLSGHATLLSSPTAFLQKTREKKAG